MLCYISLAGLRGETVISVIMNDPRIYSEDEVNDLSKEVIQSFVDSGMCYFSAHKVLEAHIAVMEKAFADLGHNALYEFGTQKITYKL